jgi:ubiquinone/menaquinone biosynthesis C-methylase UbiE
MMPTFCRTPNSACYADQQIYRLYAPKMTDTDKQFKNSFSGKGVFPPKYAFTLLVPFRNIFLSPKKLLQRLDIKEDHKILEIGPGPGYFSTHIANKLKGGRLVLLDIQQEMLDFAKKRLDKRKIVNVEYKLTDGISLELESDFFDRVILVAVIGEVGNKNNYLKEIYRILKEDGTLSISELAGDPDKLSINELKSLVFSCGFKTNEVFGGKLNYTINFKKIIKQNI